MSADELYRDAVTRLRAGDATTAVDLLRRLLRDRPHDATVRAVLGEAHRQTGKLDDAVTQYEEAVRLDPAELRYLANLGGLLIDSGRMLQGIEVLRRVLSRWPGDVVAARNLASALIQAGDPATALAAVHTLPPQAPGVYTAADRVVMHGNALLAAGQYDAAIATFAHADSIDPDNPDAAYGRAIASLALARRREGYALLHARLRTKALAALSLPAGIAPAWRGEDPRGKRIYVMCEQGAGDAIQFARFLPLLAQRGADVILGCNPLLTSLLSTVAGVVQASALQPPPPHDFSLALLDLPALLDAEPAFTPYLRAAPARIQYYRSLLHQKSGGAQTCFAGICWSGNPKQPVNPKRSAPPAIFLPLAKPGIRLVSLQKVLPPGQSVPKGVIDIQDQVHDFADTAALLCALDHVITTDTSIAHLAGALGLPAQVLLHSPGPHWTWEDAAWWYPTIRTVRQPAFGQWAPAIAAAADRL
jgi:Flp pilus assembly protein TadD